MKIIKQGKSEKELNVILNKTRRFKCDICGCVFEADWDEYTHKSYLNETLYYCKCPNCKIHIAYEVKMRGEEK